MRSRQAVSANAIRDWREVRAGRGWRFCVMLRASARGPTNRVVQTAEREDILDDGEFRGPQNSNRCKGIE